MRTRYLIIFVVLAIVSCRAKNDSSAETESKLKTAMQAYLYNAINNDSTNTKYRVLSVTYYEEKDKYLCEFEVYLKAKLFDTTGIMKANVSKDFKKVERFR